VGDFPIFQQLQSGLAGRVMGCRPISATFVFAPHVHDRPGIFEGVIGYRGNGIQDLYPPLWWADSLGRIINQDVDMVAFFTLSHDDGTTLLGRNEPSPTFYVYKLFQQLGTEKLHTDSGIDNVSIFAAQREDGTLTLMLVNRGPDEVTAPLQVDGYEGGSTEL
jgi:hypothetical protein